jgi:hypothetical protein
VAEATQVVDLGTVDATVDGQAPPSVAGFPGATQHQLDRAGGMLRTTEPHA